MLQLKSNVRRELIVRNGNHGQRGKLAALLYEGLDEAITARGALHARIAQCAHAGRLLVVESGRDCDGVQYTGRRHEIDATVKAYYELGNQIAEWADGPFSLAIVPYDTEVEYTSRDLALEAFENGHAHCLYA